MESWRLVTTWDADPALCMGLDEVLLEGQGEAPALRLYTWRPATLSLGYFQRLGDVPAVGQSQAVVRRITGGGAIHHAAELTFSIAADLEHPLYRGPVAESYERVHAAIALALTDFGIEAQLRGPAALSSDREGSGMCFHHSTALDLCWGGAKGVGSAQRRRGARVLHHGSIKLGADPFEPGVAVVGGTADAAGVGASLLRALARTHGIDFEARPPSAAEERRALELGQRSSDPAFLRGRRG